MVRRGILQEKNLPKSPLTTARTNGMWEDSSGKSEFDNLTEGWGTLESEVGQYLSVDFDLLFVQSSDKS